ncbi:Na(+)-translocating NADH-quinone reductase subunit C [Saccharophagus degradans]|uniref:Na(+)-translocating NADH-quinone reductase subunit C n=1 Tax=Saccharophagus degradans TaxID=86304 RepID=A0AAW7X9C9_9GAMM|nr:Na(+)-translocating NADH-quinone reductase subunit C [Saccharophagus degradans]MBU2984217.1 Na(+)-translocating NADH-quinone reductase subunit C [Saccharophagus degradans]MDO6424124.1 Na(+)-translocating NADH-quinone reductase subunit C [Saccharophagus degradans]MDO6608171.1 Na(+)-translocating NADH-quinone reductase subunit C [Saccharophagus degradans]WGO96700.1 Na(+)-translocating NADH-quinone reductase subunit C [Saccharophagus degradans]
MANNDSIKKTFIVAAVLCIVCSVIVSSASVMLKPMQSANKALDFKRNILMAAGMYDESKSVDDMFQQISVKVINLETGKFTDEVDASKYDQRKASKDPARSESLDKSTDIAGLGRIEKYSYVYIVEGANGDIEKLILPIRGYGLWSTLRGFVALKSDLNTVIGLGYYEHGETPGLGGEVDNPAWKAKWEGKKVYGSDNEVLLSVIKGSVSSDTPNAEHKVDGLSGATLTSDGVDNMIKFWLGENGFAPFLANLKSGEA